jgi:carboxylesterase 1
MSRTVEQVQGSLKANKSLTLLQSSTLLLFLPCQVLSPLAKNLFHRAISESGVVLTTGLFEKKIGPIAEVSLTLDDSGTLSPAFFVSLGIFLPVGFR